MRGLDRDAVAAEVRAGRLCRVSPGWVAVPGIDPRLVRASTLGGVVSCAHAAQLHGLEMLRVPGPLHVSVPPTGTRRAGVTHRRTLASDCLVTTLTQTAADCARCLSRVEGLVIVDAALRRGVAREDIMVHLVGPGSGLARMVVAAGDARSAAVGETVARDLLVRESLPFEPRAYVSGVGWVDFLVAGWLVVEIDGFAYHSSRSSFAEDRRRNAALAAQGFVVVRFTHRDVLERSAYVIASVRQILAQREARER